MREEKQFSMAWARFNALRSNIPNWIKKDQVNDYHSILDALEQASGEDLGVFRIPHHQLKPRITGAILATRRSPGRTYYSDEDYCDDTFFVRQIDGVANYFKSLETREKPHTDRPADYWSMSDSDLELLANKYSIAPISRAGAQGEIWYVDRDRIIDALLKRENALKEGESPPSRPNVINVGTMYGSTIQQATENTSATIDYKSQEAGLRDLLSQIRSSMNALELSAAARTQIDVDARTVEAQLLSPHPKPVVVRESLQSMRNILEGMVGSVIASGLVFEIGKYLGS